MDISTYAGHDINIRFRFDTGDEYNNNYLGWFVDNVSIEATSVSPITLTPLQGTVAVGDSTHVTVEFASSQLPLGNYVAYLEIMSNDPDEPVVFLPVQLHIRMPFVCGDADGDGTLTIADAVRLVLYLFANGDAPDPVELGDANGDGTINVVDPVYLINFIFNGGPQPCAN